MSATSFKNSRPRRKYRQRAQPQAREHLGLLEKKKDYVQRAKNYHQKQDTINKLRQKAALANPEEFYFRMIKGKQKDGGHYELSSDQEDLDANEYKKQLKKENANIVVMQSMIESKKADRLKQTLHLIDAPKQNNHKLFVYSKQQLSKSLPQYMNTPVQLVQSSTALFSQSQLHKISLQGYQSINATKTKQKYNQLAQTLQKSDKMKKMYLKINYQKNLLTKQRRRIKKNKDGSGYKKFFMERKK